MFRALPLGIAAVAALFLVLGSGPRPAEAATTVLVTSNANSGPGSFRAAVDQANGNSNVGIIKFLVNGPITLQSSVVYTNTQALTLSGLYKTVIQGTTAAPVSTTFDCGEYGLFTSTSAADLTFVSLTFQNADCGSGIRVQLPDAERTVHVTLNGVSLRNNDQYGLFIDEDDYDCDSAASIDLNLWYSTAVDNDEDGVGVREFGYGFMTASVNFSSFRNNGGDGLDLTEHCDGNFTLNTAASSFNDNGSNGIFGEESDDGSAIVTLNGLDALNNGDDGVQIGEDDQAQDGSIDSANGDDPTPPATEEDGPELASCYGGSLDFTINGGRANGNDSDGIDLDEYDCGNVNVWLNGFVANSNADDGIDVYESYGGDLYFRSTSATSASYNGRDDEDGNGFQLYEEGYGSVDAQIDRGTASYNGDDEESGDGIEIHEHNKGDLTLLVTLTAVLGNLEDGVDLEENGHGDLDSTFVSSTVSINADDGIEAYQDDCNDDYGEVTLVLSSVVANGDNNIALDGDVIQN